MSDPTLPGNSQNAPQHQSSPGSGGHRQLEALPERRSGSRGKVIGGVVAAALVVAIAGGGWVPGVITLNPGDLVFTGTPQGVGLGRDPQVYIRAGQELVSTIDGIGELRQRFVASGSDGAPTVHTLKGSAS